MGNHSLSALNVIEYIISNNIELFLSESDREIRQRTHIAGGICNGNISFRKYEKLAGFVQRKYNKGKMYIDILWKKETDGL